MTPPLIRAVELSKSFGDIVAVNQISFELYPGEVLGIVGESGSGKTTLLNILSGAIKPNSGELYFAGRDGCERNFFSLRERERRALMRTDMGFVHQDPALGLRLKVSAGGNVAERLLSGSLRNYGEARARAAEWLNKVELPLARLDSRPEEYSGGMRQRLQIARNLVTSPRLVYMDEPTGGLDVSVQARVLDLIRGLSAEFNLAVVLVTHDLGVARLLTERLLVMKNGKIIERGLTDQVLDDPQEAYTQLLVSSVLGEA
ncbi:MAG: phosphonate C-P lyase system protein PhnK [Deltaproteobacteria bacterium]|jgi:putative phosphonate transport system ATP-binding protein|nr:phosphonate C-P lyase system protein PhnK [Deltaproteobacteria bacterium]